MGHRPRAQPCLDLALPCRHSPCPNHSEPLTTWSEHSIDACELPQGRLDLFRTLWIEPHESTEQATE